MRKKRGKEQLNTQVKKKEKKKSNFPANKLLIFTGSWEEFAWHLGTHYNINLLCEVVGAQRSGMIPILIL